MVETILVETWGKWKFPSPEINNLWQLARDSPISFVRFISVVSYFVSGFLFNTAADLVYALVRFLIILSKTVIIAHSCTDSGFRFCFIVMSRLTLPIPSYKIRRLLLPSAVFLAGITIFVCGMVRTYNITNVTKSSFEDNLVRRQNDRTEWWVGFPVSSKNISC